MMRILLAISAFFVAAIFLAPLIAIQFFSQKAEYSFRMTVAVEVDGEVKEGSSVIHVAHRNPPRWLWGLFNFETWVNGEAVFVDLGQRGNLVAALVIGPQGRSHSFGSMALGAFHIGIFDFGAKVSEHPLPPLGARAELKRDRIPTLVTFRDVQDPDSVRLVPPPDFSAVFGTGITFRGAWIEMTDAPVTRSIDEKLPLMRVLRERSKTMIAVPPGFYPDSYYFSRWDR